MTLFAHTTDDTRRRSTRRAMLLGAAVLPSVAAAPLDTSQSPSLDADLIALCARHPALIAAVNASPIDFDKCPASAPYLLSRDAIHDARPVTLEGLRAKALAAKVEARNPD